MRWDLGVRNESCGDGSEGDEKRGAEVGSEPRDEACDCGEGDFFFDVEV